MWWQLYILLSALIHLPTHDSPSSFSLTAGGVWAAVSEQHPLIPNQNQNNPRPLMLTDDDDDDEDQELHNWLQSAPESTTRTQPEDAESDQLLPQDSLAQSPADPKLAEVDDDDDEEEEILPVQDRDLITTHPNWKQIVRECRRFGNQSAHQKLFQSGRTLAFVTPWNNHGYDIAKWFRGKFDYVAPVWLQLHRVGKVAYEVRGKQDVDRNWMAAVRSFPHSSSETRAQIVPRVIMEQWNQVDFETLVHSGDGPETRAFVRTLVNVCEEFDFDGLVVEMTMPQLFPVLIRMLGTEMKRNGRSLILVISPSSRFPPNMPTFHHKLFMELKDYVDAFSLMTYDYSSPANPGPQSPIRWAEQEVKRLCPDASEDCQKILLGLNFYGADYVLPNGGGPIIGKQYLQLLSDYKPAEIHYDLTSEEHYFDYDLHYTKHVVYFPTLQSIDARIQMAEDLNVGLAIWEVGQGLDYFYDLL